MKYIVVIDGDAVQIEAKDPQEAAEAASKRQEMSLFGTVSVFSWVGDFDVSVKTEKLTQPTRRCL